MFVACWSSKGGAGTTVVASALALRFARRSHAGAVLADGSGDAPAVLGLPDPDGPGIAGWLRSGSHDTLTEVNVAPGLSLIPRGVGPLAPGRAENLADLLANDNRPVVVDCGTTPEGVTAVLAERADQSILVTRPCYLALRHLVSRSLPRPTGVVVVREPGRALSSDDVERAVGAPIVAEVDYDPAVARAVDAGLLAGRLPRSLAASLATASTLDACLMPGRLAQGSHPSLAHAAAPDTPAVSPW